MPDPTTSSPSDLLTITEAAEILRAPVATLRYWRHLGTGPESFRLGRRVLYRRDDLDAWIGAQHDRPSRPAAGRRAPAVTRVRAASPLITTTVGPRGQHDGHAVYEAGPRE